jgi:hypothetical protein
MALYSPSGHLVFVQGRTLLAQRFDLDRTALLGDPAPMGEELVLGPPGAAAFSVSVTGALAYAREAPVETRLGWVDRAGHALETIGPLPFGTFQAPAAELSPDGTRIAVQSPAGPSPDSDIWLFDLARGQATQLTFTIGADGSPIWSADGQTVVFMSQLKKPRAFINNLLEVSRKYCCFDQMMKDFLPGLRTGHQMSSCTRAGAARATTCGYSRLVAIASRIPL